ncbi:outer membrane beta-barrel protein [Shewanella sp. WXL01]|uniref:Uncharacterized protein n=1 Tax=Shewanella maritima TaxID=2520507 RepID=A0A411PH11_9GAMM|nr:MULTISPECIES: outer membrane beta-barrel protein [Shewanella]NKF49020.1 outer membrane beta-barrel protein [Shewanella sp. WXL01]QBF82835.1 hypothetical protein EXU30_09125 [Shewanella maritima]
MKKFILASIATAVLATSTVSASEFTINPMIGASNNKAFGTSFAAGVEAGYGDVLMGYTYTGTSEKTSSEFIYDGQEAFTNSKDEFSAHSIYAGYQFDVAAGKLAVKAGVEISKRKANGSFGWEAMTPTPFSTANNEGGMLQSSVKGESLVRPMVGLGYHLDNGWNFNLHYTFHRSDRQATANFTGAYMSADGFEEESIRNVKTSLSDKDMSTWMFTVGYRF